MVNYAKHRKKMQHGYKLRYYPNSQAHLLIAGGQVFEIKKKSFRLSYIIPSYKWQKLKVGQLR